VAQPDSAATSSVGSFADVPDACARLAQLVVGAEHLEPRVVGRLAVDHAETLATLAGVVERRDRVPGATAPALFGVVSEVRAHAAALAEVRPETREWHSTDPGDGQPSEQMAQIRAQLDRDRRRLRRNLTDADLWVAVKALRPALNFAPALLYVVTQSVDSQAWRPLTADPDGTPPKTALLASVNRARYTAVHANDALPASIPGSSRQAPAGDHSTAIDLAEVHTVDDVVVWLRDQRDRYLDARAAADDPVHGVAFRKIAATLDSLATVMDTGLTNRAAADALTSLSRRYRIPADPQAEDTDPDYRLATVHLAHLVDWVAAQLTQVVNGQPHRAAPTPIAGPHRGRDL
jgi:hypothetical protein